ncbi:MAG: fatty acid desaturase [Pseudomonadota bacterium]
MLNAFLQFMDGGLLNLSLGQLTVVLLAFTYFTVLSVTLYLHRCMAHRGVDLHPIVTHPMRLWLWLTTGMITKEWVAIHRKHHARCETAEDPHSPMTHGLGKVLFHGVQLYRDASKDREMIERLSHGCPDDLVERWFYGRSVIGPTLMAIIALALFGVQGITFWALQMIWIPFFAAGVINGLGHYVGYRNFTTEDTSTNLVPWAIALGGEELHNNHHAFPSSARFSMKRWEFDSGWLVLSALSAVGLAKVRRVAPKLVRDDEAQLDAEALKAVFVHRFTVMSDYCRHVIRPMVREEYGRLQGSLKARRSQVRRVLSGDERFFDAAKRERLGEVLSANDSLATVYEYRQRLQALWDRSSTDPETLLANLRQWCREAEESGIEALRNFAQSMSSYRLAPA